MAGWLVLIGVGVAYDVWAWQTGRETLTAAFRKSIPRSATPGFCVGVAAGIGIAHLFGRDD